MIKVLKKYFIFITILLCGVLCLSLLPNRNTTTETAKLNVDENACIIATTESLPPSSDDSKFDLSEQIDIKVENQSTFGICYAFASLTSLETYLALNYKEYYDFSEMHFATSLYLQDDYYSSVHDAVSSGGNFTFFTLYSQKDKSIVLEEEMPLSKYLTLSDSSLETNATKDFNNINNNFYTIAKINDTKTFPMIAGKKSNYSSSELTSFRKSVKEHLINYGALTANIHSGDTLKMNTKYYKVVDDNLALSSDDIIRNSDHMITIVGWDDKYNAHGEWANPGAYICLNSWGTSFGDNGYFYVSYDDYFIESSIAGVCDASLSTTHSKISNITQYQDKTSIHSHVFTGENVTLYTANILDVSSHVGENITHIDSFIEGSSTSFYIKFFSTLESAKSSLDSVVSNNRASLVSDYGIYSKYQLTPLAITNNYAVVVRKVTNATEIHTIAADKSYNLGIIPTYYYYETINMGYFNHYGKVWAPDISGKSNAECALPIILHTNKQYIHTNSATSDVDGFSNSTSHVKNNTIFYDKYLDLSFTNVTFTSDVLNNITIKKTNSFVDVTSNFSIELNSSTCLRLNISNDLSATFNVGNYIVSIPYNDTVIYRVIEVQEGATYNITYNLYGGSASNPSKFSSRATSLTLNNPTKAGYVFIGWYTDSEFTAEFNPNNLPKTDLTLYAKYDFALPTLTSKSSNQSLTYRKNLNLTISVNATHALLNSYNTLNYQWYKRVDKAQPFTIVDGATSSSLVLDDVVDSGFYICEISIIITDPSLVSTPCTKTLTMDENDAISITIKQLIYDMSNVKWNYSEPISYDTKIHTIELINLPDGVTASYSNNSKSDIGKYTAIATINYDNMNGNAVASPIDNLNWEIRKTRIIITINDITSNQKIDYEKLPSLYSCNIEHEYLPTEVVTLQDKINYLNLKYELIDTANPNIKTITATTNSFAIHDITIIDAEYRIIKHSLSSNNITSISDEGFVIDCVFNAETASLSDETTKLLKDKHVVSIQSYTISYSYLHDEKVSVIVPLDRNVLFNNLSVYMLKDGKLTKVSSSANANSLTFKTNEQSATYIIVQEDYSYNSNLEILILVGILSVYIAICIYIFISAFNRKKD